MSVSRLLVCTSGYGIYVIDTGTRSLVNDAREALLKNHPDDPALQKIFDPYAL